MLRYIRPDNCLQYKAYIFFVTVPVFLPIRHIKHRRVFPDIRFQIRITRPLTDYGYSLPVTETALLQYHTSEAPYNCKALPLSLPFSQYFHASVIQVPTLH